MSLPRTVQTDVWDSITASEFPVVLYGMGDAADRIADRLAKRGVEVADYFASDGFVRGHTFRGKRVLSYDEVCEKYECFTVVLAFGTRLPDVIARIFSYARKHPLYAPDLPVCGGPYFDKHFYNARYPEIKRAYGLFADDACRQIYENVIRYKLSGDIACLKAAESDPMEGWRLLNPARYRRALDGGAYNGDTIRQLLSHAPGLLEIVAAEPDPRTYKKLQSYAADITSPAIECHNVALWHEQTALPFAPKGSRGSALSLSAAEKHIAADTIDRLLAGRPVDYIKLDVEGAERNALMGAAGTIAACHPDLLVSLYHRSEDLFRLPLYIAQNHPGYRLYLRRFPYIPAWDLNLYAVWDENFS